MKKWRILLICLIGTLQLSSFAASQENGERPEEFTRVYMYGVAIDFNDSTVYLTDVQSLDSVVMYPDGSIRDLSGYSLQLKVYLEGVLGETNQTCAIIYSDKKRKLEKRFSTMRRRLQYSKGRTLKQIGRDDFAFQRR